MMPKKDSTVERLFDSGKWKGKRMNFFSNRLIVRFKLKINGVESMGSYSIEKPIDFYIVDLFGYLKIICNMNARLHQNF